MIRANKLILCAAASLCLAPLPARADHKQYVGRTGLPTVQEGKGKVWLERGVAVLEVRGDELWVTQDVKMRYPGGKLEKKGVRIKVAVREDFFRSKDNGSGDVTAGDAKGFKRFAVTVDGRRTAAGRDSWMINEKKDTATRWHTWSIDFYPGQQRHMRIVSVSPLGRDGNHRTVEFVSKDVGHWRESPEYLEIRLEAPGRIETTLAGLEPKPNDQTRRGVRWVYRKASPNRDIFVMLPDSYSTRGRANP
jgi:hypothetical protein